MNTRQTDRMFRMLKIVEMLLDNEEYKLAWRVYSIYFRTEWMRFKKVRHNRKHDALTRLADETGRDLEIFMFNQDLKDL